MLDHGALERREILERQDLLQLRVLDELALDDGELLVVLRVTDQHLQQEAVDLRLGQRIRALGLDRVLRRHDEERRRNEMRVVADRDLALLHDLEQRGLHLRRRAVDLVGQEEVAEDRAELGVERPLLRAIDARADQVRRDEVGCELHTGERSAEHSRGRLDRQGLGETGHAFDEQVALRQQAHEHALEHRILPGDDPADLEQRLLELFLRVLGRQLGVFGSVGHDGVPFSIGSSGSYESMRARGLG